MALIHAGDGLGERDMRNARLDADRESEKASGPIGIEIYSRDSSGEWAIPGP